MKKEMDPMKRHERTERMKATVSNLIIALLLPYVIIMGAATVMHYVPPLFYIAGMLAMSIINFFLLDISVRWRRAFVVAACAILLGFSAQNASLHSSDDESGKYEFTIRFIDTNMELKWRPLPKEPNQTVILKEK